MDIVVILAMYLVPFGWFLFLMNDPDYEGDPCIKPLYLSLAIFVFQMFWITYQKM